VGALPEQLEPFAWLLGTWEGEGVGGYPTIDADFRFRQRITFATYGKPVLAYTSESWALDDERPLARETGFWRPVGTRDLEVVLAVASGLVEILYGGLVSGPAGEHIAIETDVVARTGTAKEVATDKRLYAVRGGQLMYAMEMAAVGQSLQPHLSAALHPV
jgi:THAP4-like, heme-binding beta-barrel domain